jgi:hypothetical protein
MVEREVTRVDVRHPAASQVTPQLRESNDDGLRERWILRFALLLARMCDEDVLDSIRIALFEDRSRKLDPPGEARLLEQLVGGGLGRRSAGLHDTRRELEKDGLRARAELSYEHHVPRLGQRQDGHHVVLVFDLVLGFLAAGELEPLAHDAPVARVDGLLAQFPPRLHSAQSGAAAPEKR